MWVNVTFMYINVIFVYIKNLTDVTFMYINVTFMYIKFSRPLATDVGFMWYS